MYCARTALCLAGDLRGRAVLIFAEAGGAVNEADTGIVRSVAYAAGRSDLHKFSDSDL